MLIDIICAGRFIRRGEETSTMVGRSPEEHDSQVSPPSIPLAQSNLDLRLPSPSRLLMIP